MSQYQPLQLLAIAIYASENFVQLCFFLVTSRANRRIPDRTAFGL